MCYGFCVVYPLGVTDYWDVVSVCMNPFLSKKGNSSGGVYPVCSVLRICGYEWSSLIRFCVYCVSDDLAKTVSAQFENVVVYL